MTGCLLIVLIIFFGALGGLPGIGMLLVAAAVITAIGVPLLAGGDDGPGPGAAVIVVLLILGAIALCLFGQ